MPEPYEQDRRPPSTAAGIVAVITGSLLGLFGLSWFALFSLFGPNLLGYKGEGPISQNVFWCVYMLLNLVEAWIGILVLRHSPGMRTKALAYQALYAFAFSGISILSDGIGNFISGAIIFLFVPAIITLLLVKPY